MSAVEDHRLPALRRFAFAISLLNLLGHTVLGFEQSWATPFVALLAAYGTEILLEILEAKRAGRKSRFLRPGTAPIDFILSAHITGLAVGMLLYPGETLLPIAFGASAAIASKHVFRVTVGGRSRHFLNPSNFGISLTLLSFSWVGIVQPYMFTENLSTTWRWLFPAIMVCVGSLLNVRLTKKGPLLAAWLSCFVLQAAVRHLLFGNAFLGSLAPMTGIAFLLFTFYMVTDPATTPASARGQILFGSLVALCYGALVAAHVVFTLFFALTAACSLRGGWLAWRAAAGARGRQRVEPAGEMALAAERGVPGLPGL